MTTTEKLCEIKLYYKPKISAKTQITCSGDAYKQVLKFFDHNTIALQEQFIILYLNRANMILGAHQLFTGGLTGTIADIRLIMGIALKSMACGIIISHNHPSGNLIPSEADRTLTDKVKKACDLMDIKLYDHIIVSPYEETYFSFADESLI
jgi:DNA repair protein RadC